MTAETTTLDDLVESGRSITYGVVKPGPEVPNGIRFVRGGDVVNGRIAISELRTISPQLSEQYKRTLLRGGELLVSLVGNPGEVAVVPPKLTGANIARQVGLVPLNGDVNPGFVMYYLRSPRGRAELFVRTQGAVQQVINLSDLKKVKIPHWSRSLQDRVVEVLSAYDDLIENNRRRIQLLEQAARLLYKEWFVHLRYPGHEHVKIKGGVPEGWEKKTAFEVMEVLSGGTPKTTIPAYWDGDIPFFTPKDAVDYAYVAKTEKTITEDGLKNCNSKLYPKDTVFITARGTVGKINLAQTDMAMNQSCYALVSKAPINQHFLYFALVEGVEQFRSRAVGAVFDAIIRDTFKLIPFVVPDEKLIVMFTEHVKPILNQIDVLSTKTRKLEEARDLLLPRLMSGEVVA